MNRIPKIIHYCWFGNNQMPNRFKYYIAGWHKKCPNYKFICWSENNFNYKKCPFTKYEYIKHNWAFVSDYVRLYALKKFGGIYLDTDVEVLRNLDPLLSNNSFIGLEDWDSINSGLIYGSKSNDRNIINIMKIYHCISSNYKNLNFIYDNTVNIITDYFHNIGFKYKNIKQNVNGCTIYPTEYFCPQRFGSNKINITKNTYTFHHYDGSWTKKKMNTKKKIHIEEGRILRRLIGRKYFNKFYYFYKYHKF